MKKLLILTSLICLLSCAQSQASTIIMDYQGETVVHQRSVERNLIINSDDDGIYNIAIRPLETELRSNDGRYVIPLSNLYINNTHEDVYLRYNEYSNLFYNLQMGGIPKNMTAKIRDYGMIPAGTYNMNFEIQATDVETGSIASMTTFNLQFIVPVLQEINLHSDISEITISAENAFKQNQKIANDRSPMVYINSNADWVLSLRADDLNEDISNYYVRTISASSNVNERLQERTLVTQGKEIILAKGVAPSNNEYVTVEYSIESKDNKIIRAGKYDNRVKYILREAR